MIVLINCLSAGSGGALTYLRNCLPLLARTFAEDAAGHRLVVLAHRRHVEGLILPPGVSVISPSYSRLSGGLRVIWELLFLRRICERTGAGIVFTPYQVSVTLRNVKTVLMLRNMEPFAFRSYENSLRAHLRNELLSRITPRALRRASRVIAVSEYARAYATDVLKIPGQSVTTIYHGKDLRFSPIRPAADVVALRSLRIDRPFALICGSVVPYRRIEDVVRAWERLAKTVNDVPGLIIAGSSIDSRYSGFLRELLEKSEVRHLVRFVGHQEIDTLAALYRNAAVLVMSTEVEACSNVAIEAMASGCPVVAADVPALRDVFRDAAIYYSPRSVDGLAGSLAALLVEPDLRSGLVQSALVEARRFDWEVTARQTYRALTSWDGAASG